MCFCLRLSAGLTTKQRTRRCCIETLDDNIENIYRDLEGSANKGSVGETASCCGDRRGRKLTALTFGIECKLWL
jgi:hypothetical protein